MGLQMSRYIFQTELVSGIRLTDGRDIVVHKGYPAGYIGEFHKHTPADVCELIYVDSGQITVEFEGSFSCCIDAGCCCFIKSDVRHRICNHLKTPSTYLNIMFYGKLPESLCMCSKTVGSESHRITSHLREELISDDPYSMEVCCCMLTEFIISILRKENRSISVRRPRFIDNLQTERAEKIFDMMSREYSRITFTRIAKRIGVSRSALYLIFKKELGHSFSELLEHFRLEQAEYLLQKGVFSLSEIASEVGCDKTTLFRLFKKRKGITPHEYAKTLGNSQKMPDIP